VKAERLFLNTPKHRDEWALISRLGLAALCTTTTHYGPIGLNFLSGMAFTSRGTLVSLKRRQKWITHLLENIITKHPLLETQHFLQIPLGWRLAVLDTRKPCSAMALTLSCDYAATVSALGFRIDSSNRMLLGISLISLARSRHSARAAPSSMPLRHHALQRATWRVLRRP
jgi:hypothetical protein